MAHQKEKTLADELREENERLRRRFIHHTRPKRPLTMDEARELAERVSGDEQASSPCLQEK